MSGFTGTLTNLVYHSTLDGLVLDGLILWDDLALGDGVVVDDILDWDDIADLDGYLFDSLGTIDSTSGVQPYGFYDFSAQTDLGAVYSVHFTRRLRIEPFNLAVLFDDNIAELDTWGDFDGTDISSVNAWISIRSTEDDPNNNPTWSEWTPVTNNLIRGRAFQYRAELESNQLTQNAAMVDIGINLALALRTEASANHTTGAASYTVTFPNTFYEPPALSITPYNMNTGDYYQLSRLEFDSISSNIDTWPDFDSFAITETGFTITFYNSSSTIVDRTFDYSATGPGAKL